MSKLSRPIAVTTALALTASALVAPAASAVTYTPQPNGNCSIEWTAEDVAKLSVDGITAKPGVYNYTNDEVLDQIALYNTQYVAYSEAKAQLIAYYRNGLIDADTFRTEYARVDNYESSFKEHLAGLQKCADAAAKEEKPAPEEETPAPEEEKPAPEEEKPAPTTDDDTKPGADKEKEGLSEGAKIGLIVGGVAVALIAIIGAVFAFAKDMLPAGLAAMLP